MKELKEFYLQEFTLTTRDINQIFSKNTVMHIDISDLPECSFNIPESYDWTDFPKEKEVLLLPYTKYLLTKHELVDGVNLFYLKVIS